MSSKANMIYSPKKSEEYEILDAPPAYTPTADYNPPHQQETYSSQPYIPPTNPNYVSTSGPSVFNNHPHQQPQQQQQQQQQQVDYYNNPENRKMSTFQYSFNRGIIGNAFDFASHTVSGATSRASARSTNDATKAILDTVGGFLENRLNKKQEKELLKEMEHARKHECKELRREAKQERRALKEQRKALKHGNCFNYHASYLCDHSQQQPQQPQAPQPHQRYGGSSYCCSRRC